MDMAMREEFLGEQDNERMKLNSHSKVKKEMYVQRCYIYTIGPTNCKAKTVTNLTTNDNDF